MTEEKKSVTCKIAYRIRFLFTLIIAFNHALVSPIQCDQMATYLAIYNNENLPSSMNITLVSLKFYQILIEP